MPNVSSTWFYHAIQKVLQCTVSTKNTNTLLPTTPAISRVCKPQHGSHVHCIGHDGQIVGQLVYWKQGIYLKCIPIRNLAHIID